MAAQTEQQLVSTRVHVGSQQRILSWGTKSLSLKVLEDCGVIPTQDEEDSSVTSSLRGKRSRGGSDALCLLDLPLARIINLEWKEIEGAAGVLSLVYVPVGVKQASFLAEQKNRSTAEGDLSPLGEVTLEGKSSSATPPVVAKIQLRTVTDDQSSFTNLAKIAAWLESRIYPDGPVNITAFVSPVSGAGKAVSLWSAMGETILAHSRHRLNTVITQRPLHAQDFVEDPAQFAFTPEDVVVAAGGDGMMFEVINGLKRRALKQVTGGTTGPFQCPCPVLDVPTNIKDDLPKLPSCESLGDGSTLPKLAAFACGSGCGSACAMDVLDLVTAVTSIVQGYSVAVDLLRSQEVPTVQHHPAPRTWWGTRPEHGGQKEALDPLAERAAKKPRTEKEQAAFDVAKANSAFHKGSPIWSFLCFQFAITAEVDKGSEMFRWLGNARFEAYAIKLVLTGVPVYPCTIKYVPWTGDGEVAAGEGRPLPIGAQHDWGPDGTNAPLGLNAEGMQCTLDPTCHCQQAKVETKKAKDAEENDRWIDHPLDKVWFGNIATNPCLTQDTIFAPFAHIGSGAMDMVLASGEGATRWKFLKTFLNMENGAQILAPAPAMDGAPAPSHDWHYTKAKKILIQPHHGIIGPDGEYARQLSGYFIEKERKGIRFVRQQSVGGHVWPKSPK